MPSSAGSARRCAEQAAAARGPAEDAPPAGRRRSKEASSTFLLRRMELVDYKQKENPSERESQPSTPKAKGVFTLLNIVLLSVAFKLHTSV